VQLDDIKSIYFLGIGGIGMSALARYFHGRGVAVHGYDRTATPLTRALEDEGMQIHYTEDVGQIPAQVDLVVWTPAVPREHAELRYFQEKAIPLKKRSEVLGLISRHKRTVAIGGTHGKTTTSSLTAHLLRAGGIDATAFVGGLAVNLNGNFVEGASDWVVAEADEYDRSFLQLFPDIAIINSIDPDHLDIYGSAEAVRDAYAQFAHQVKPGGWVLYKAGLPFNQVAADLAGAGRQVATFGIDHGNYCATNLRIENGYLVFDLRTPHHGNFEALRLRYPGRHNVENATAAAAAALLAGADPQRLHQALADFRGVERRFEYIVRRDNVVYIDDYAHHPAELEATIAAARQLFPGRRLTGVFQPHLYSRTRDFADGFAAALDKLDEPILLDIYPAREEPIPGVSAATILDKMNNDRKQLATKDDLLDLLKKKNIDVLLTLGAGDIDTMVGPIRSLLEEKLTTGQNLNP
jgi:UDP-N-acetylmuramate--alanine ligase